MSASPAAGPTPNGAPAGAPKPVRRRKPAANPLVTRKPPGARKLPPEITEASTGPTITSRNGDQAPQTQGPQARNWMQSGLLSEKDVIVGEEETLDENLGPGETYRLVATPRQLIEGMRHHTMRLLAKKPVNIFDTEEFVRPIRLHRRDPRAPPAGVLAATQPEDKEEEEQQALREKLEAERAERAAIREEKQALIAPTARAPAQPKQKTFQKKTEQVYRTDDTPEARKRNKLRYEETLPWHLEDEGKNVWVGNYEEALSECHAVLYPEGNSFRMLPVEKWYKFSQKAISRHQVIESTADGKKTLKRIHFLGKVDEKLAKIKQEEDAKKRTSRLKTREGEEEGARRVKNEDEDDFTRELPDDVNDIDFNIEDDFADDEENALFEGDEEEAKDAEKRIKEEQKEANVFELREEKDYDAEEEAEKAKKEKERKLQKRTRKALMKREKNTIYESDTDENPYTSESESEDSEMERQLEEERKKEEERKATDPKGKGKEAEKPQPSSGTNTKGSNTPSNRAEKKPVDPLKTHKRKPGSPNASDIGSGNESTRKKIKKEHVAGGAGSAPTSRRPSPGAADSPARVVPKKRLNGAGAGSDSEATGNEGRPKKLKLKQGSPVNGSPAVSRAGSPVVAPSGSTTLPTKDEIAAAVPAEGIPLGLFMKKFKGRAGVTVEQKKTFADLMRAASRYDKETKMLFPKAPS